VGQVANLPFARQVGNLPHEFGYKLFCIFGFAFCILQGYPRGSEYLTRGVGLIYGFSVG